MILQDKVALVTGGTTGIGRATALAFAQRSEGKLNEVIALGAAGAKVVFSGRRDAEGEKTTKLICETGAECLYVHSDASNEEDIKALVQNTVATYGRLDCASIMQALNHPENRYTSNRSKSLTTSWRLTCEEYFYA
ncbi:SDR family NAD(P)-dependent oxidoreductase [Scytonema sp. PCC 10023]|uniref:SDR family NAD(P)-dependent oxidoreductase n=1 Tax=Scytonema sp. PCC 10023 TaxID=1680591 RepID=UPI0039C754CF